MIKIGFVDYYLDNWHANFYPGFMREAIAKYGYDARIEYAAALCEKEDGQSSRDWCRERNITLLDSVQEVCDKSDAIMVIAADNSAWHEEVCDIPLRSGKPVFVDKTFAPSLEAGKRLFDLAERHHTPVFSSSAQRYCQSILDYLAKRQGRTMFCSTVGPHALAGYAVHQLEPIVAIMGTGVKRVKCFSVGTAVTQLILDYGEGRLAGFTQSPQPFAEFNFMVSDGERGQRLDSSDYYVNLQKAILDFFADKQPPVRREETLEILAIIDTAIACRERQDEWFPITY